MFGKNSASIGEKNSAVQAKKDLSAQSGREVSVYVQRAQLSTHYLAGVKLKVLSNGRLKQIELQIGNIDVTEFQ
ncbi:hypothetical protein A7K50_09650 [Dehalobacter sp. MCB1]|uniref:hypothetical protein n=1 Tax=Dehalobacter sp. MCB1 TaxID=1844756 RepID=UPI000E6C5CAC|nr:hypothetical protein [Dehalobacter sp. MCB1]RJE48507.1 hypothetical protein A7K50_09650 [Dehalobacter sp. MCB1]